VKVDDWEFTVDSTTSQIMD